MTNSSDYIWKSGNMKDFEMDDELSTKDDLVLHNAKTGETVISYRGTTDDPVGKPKNFVKDFGSSVAEGIAAGDTLSCSIMHGGSIKCWSWIQSYDNGYRVDIQYPLLDVYRGSALSVAVGGLGGQVKDSDTCNDFS